VRRWPFVAFVVFVSTRALADGADPTTEARDAFKRGADLARDEQWNGALLAFERSATLVPHPWTTYNIGVCERALGHYVRARDLFASVTGAPELPAQARAQADDMLREARGLIATVDVTVDPSDAALVVDGVAKPTAGAKATLDLDPGHHVFTLRHEGYADGSTPRDLRPGEHATLTLALARLPATLAVRASQPNAVVEVDGLDVGVAPLSLERGGGPHRVRIRLPGYTPFETETKLLPGQRVEVFAPLRIEKPSIFTRWWFWTGAVAAVATIAVVTWAIAKPAPEAPPVDGGGLGWAVRFQ
jgi:hypothetical protein